MGGGHSDGVVCGCLLDALKEGHQGALQQLQQALPGRPPLRVLRTVQPAQHTEPALLAHTSDH